jgi:hypothetical protein
MVSENRADLFFKNAQKWQKMTKKSFFLTGNILPIKPLKNPIFQHYITDMHLI